MLRRQFRGLDSDISRFLVESYWFCVGYRVEWCDDGPLALDEQNEPLLWSFAGRIVPEDLRDQRLGFMRAAGWIPEGEFSLGADGVRFSDRHTGQARVGEPWIVPENVLPLDKVSLALAATVVDTGDASIDGLRLDSDDEAWRAFDLHSREMTPDTVPSTTPPAWGTVRDRLEAADLAAFRELAGEPGTQTPTRRWWRR